MTRKNRNRALRNLAIAAVLIFAIWLALGAPLPTAQLRLRRAERQNLLETSEIVWHYDSRNYLGMDTAFKGLDTLVGLTPKSVHIYARDLTVWPRNPDRHPTLVVLPAELSYETENGWDQAPALLAVDPPAEAASARLTLTLNLAYYDGAYGDKQSIVQQFPPEKYIVDGVQDGGLFFFQLTRHYPYFDNRDDEEARYRYYAENEAFYSFPRNVDSTGRLAGQTVSSVLEFFDKDGALISCMGLGAKVQSISPSS